MKRVLIKSGHYAKITGCRYIQNSTIVDLPKNNYLFRYLLQNLQIFSCTTKRTFKNTRNIYTIHFPVCNLLSNGLVKPNRSYTVSDTKQNTKNKKKHTCSYLICSSLVSEQLGCLCVCVCNYYRVMTVPSSSTPPLGSARLCRGSVFSELRILCRLPLLLRSAGLLV